MGKKFVTIDQKTICSISGENSIFLRVFGADLFLVRLYTKIPGDDILLFILKNTMLYEKRSPSQRWKISNEDLVKIWSRSDAPKYIFQFSAFWLKTKAFSSTIRASCGLLWVQNYPCPWKRKDSKLSIPVGKWSRNSKMNLVLPKKHPKICFPVLGWEWYIGGIKKN